MQKPKNRAAAAIADASRRHRIPLTPAQVWLLAGAATEAVAVLPRSPEPVPSGAPLGGSHLALLILIANGVSDQDCARRLGWAEATVRSAMKTVLERLGAANRTQAVAIALSRRLIAPTQIHTPQGVPRQKSGRKPRDAA